MASRAVNLYFTSQGQTVLRYGCGEGSRRERVVARPTALLTLAADSEAAVEGQGLASARAVLFHAFRGMTLNPTGAWHLAGEFSPEYRMVFDHLLRFFHAPADERWCVRGEPGKFLHFGYRTAEGEYFLGAFVLPWGKPTVFTFRAEDLIQALPPKRPFATMTVETLGDGLPLQRVSGMGWDTRVRLPLVEDGAVLLHFIPEDQEVE